MGVPESFWTKPSTTGSVSILIRLIWITTLCLIAVWTGSYLGGFSSKAENGNTSKLFNWHPLLMVLAIPVLMTESVLAYRAPPLSMVPRSMRKLVHSILHVFSVICVFGAMVSVVASHRIPTPPIPDLAMAHSWVGVTALCLFGIQFLLGGAMFLLAGVRQSTKVVFSDVHGFLGRATYFVGLATIVSGLVEKLAFIHKAHPDPNEPAIMIPKVVIILLTILGLLVGFLHTFQEKEKLPEAPPPEQEALIEDKA
ncbi:hypothetical protein BSKO_10488 [Bryopsis sp. KO-2023]|nr:hypothetical protein BSKO_10488 [Bryopsis sp. KO-2023]